MIWLVEAFLVALVLTLVLTPSGIRVAWATGYLDHPEARKLHTSATALLGGVVVFVCACLAWLGVWRLAGPGTDGEVGRLLAGALVALLIGMWDDKFGMQPLIKLGGQAAAAG